MAIQITTIKQESVSVIRKLMTKTGRYVLPTLALLSIFAGSFIGDNSDGEQAYLQAAPVSGGAIKGIVKFPKDYPEREKITVTKDQAICGAFQYSELFVVSESNHGLKNVVVSLVGAKGKVKKQSGAALTLQQTKCRYVPHVQAIPVGTLLEIRNNDGILHNVHVYYDDDMYGDQVTAKKTIFNKAQPKFRKRIKQKIDKPGMYFYRCDVHSHMSAYIAVMDHPYYDVTGDGGEFTISDVPPGTYKIQAWHEIIGKMEKEVVVKAGETAEVVFDILPNE